MSCAKPLANSTFCWLPPEKLPTGSLRRCLGNSTRPATSCSMARSRLGLSQRLANEPHTSPDSDMFSRAGRPSAKPSFLRSDGLYQILLAVQAEAGLRQLALATSHQTGDADDLTSAHLQAGIAHRDLTHLVTQGHIVHY